MSITSNLSGKLPRSKFPCGVDIFVTTWYLCCTMEKLRIFLNSLLRDEQAAFAIACGTTIGYLRKAISTGTELGVPLCCDIERESAFRVTRFDLRPDNWHRNWPDLIGKPGSPPVPAEREVA
ncbi:hypothetical protein OKW30_001391 [Paraburkholderia sp. Clong3]|uniref:Cro/Cl family transcriptional regulator n=1 Tax=Paraburkholderia sp. Clong3 TaxID=2991061 RepID=UPI003D2229B3